MTTPVAATFDERLRDGALALGGAAICAGIDPTPDACRLVAGGDLDIGSRSHADAIERLGRELVAAAAGVAVAIKPQLAWFELAGPAGIEALGRVVADARDAGLLVVMDAKRGDVPHSARAYAEAWLGEDAPSGAGGDALTVNGWIGPDAIAAMNEVAQLRGCTIYVLLLTSNPGAADWLGIETTDGRPWWHHVAGRLASEGCGAVVGATRPDQLEAVRRLLPESALLVPGVGAQGGSIADLVPLASPAAPPPLVSLSRSLLPGSPVTSRDLRLHARARLAEAADDYARSVGSRVFASIDVG